METHFTNRTAIKRIILNLALYRESHIRIKCNYSMVVMFLKSETERHQYVRILTFKNTCTKVYKKGRTQSCIVTNDTQEGTTSIYVRGYSAQ